MKTLFFFAAFFIFAAACVHAGALEDGKDLYSQGNLSGASQKYKMACDGRNMEACGLLGQMYADGDGVRKNIRKGVSLYDKACSGNDAFACNNLGSLYDRGNGVPMNKQRALDLFNKACRLKNEVACANAKTLTEYLKNRRPANEKEVIRYKYIKRYY